ncbi:MAG: hypothetical protein HY721_08225 [Planctomycetes bacterium]|nr:hypothetical protein [Planctomycetota bacterium]
MLRACTRGAPACALAVLLASRAAAPGQEPPAPPPSTVEVTEVHFPEAIARNLPGRGAWLPAYVELKAARGQAETVAIEATVEKDRDVTYRETLRFEVAPGAPRRAWVYFRVSPGEGIQTLRLEARSAAGAVIHRGGPWQAFVASQAARLSMLVVLEKTGGDIEPWPGQLSSASGASDLSEEVAACQARKLPDSVRGYHGLDMVVIRDPAAGSLEPAQLEALRSWVYLGGRVVLAPSGRSGEIFESPLARALLGDALGEPQVEHGFVPGDLYWIDAGERSASPQTLASRQDLEIPGDISYTRLDPLRARPAREIASAQDAARGDEPGETRRVFRRIYGEVGVGRGGVGVLTIDDQAHRTAGTQDFLKALWWRIVRFGIGEGGGRALEGAARTVVPELAEALKEKRDVGVGVMVGLIGGYLAVVGPGLFLVLKRLRRLPAVIWAEPLLVVVYLAIIFATAYVTKGVLTTTRLHTFISQRAGESLALRESYLSIFSAAESHYRVTSPRGSMLLPLYKNTGEEQPVRLSRQPSGELSLADHKLAHWQEGHFVNAGVVDLGGPGVELDDLRVTNRLDHRIEEGLYRYQNAYLLVPALEPGGSVEVKPAPADEKTLEGFKRRWRLSGLGLGQGGDRPLFAAYLSRSEEDFRVDGRTTLRERRDLYLLYD